VCLGELEDGRGPGGIVWIVDDLQQTCGDEVWKDGVDVQVVGECECGVVYELDFEPDPPGVSVEGGKADTHLWELEKGEDFPVCGRIAFDDRTIELTSQGGG